MPGAIAAYCRATGQTPPDVQAPGEVMRCVLESLALAYRQALERTEALTGHRFPGLHVVRGGTRNEILLQFTADAIGRPISSGPTEATAIGNLLGQLMASGHIASLREGRALVRESFPIRTVEPGERGKGGTRRFIGDGPSFFLSPYDPITLALPLHKHLPRHMRKDLRRSVVGHPECLAQLETPVVHPETDDHMEGHVRFKDGGVAGLQAGRALVPAGARVADTDRVADAGRLLDPVGSGDRAPGGLH